MRIYPVVGLIGITLCSCISTKSEVEFKPVEIKVTVDVNVKVQVDKELKNVFQDIDNKQKILQDEGEKEGK